MKIKLLIVAVLLVVSCKEEKKEISTETAQETVVTSISNDNGYTDLEGNKIELSNYKGKRVLLNFWATWCRPCIEEMPSLLEAEELLENENYVVLLATDQPIKTINSFKKRKGFNFTYLKYNGAFSDLGIKALPKTFIYNTKGEKVDEISGAMEWSSPEVIERLKAVN